MNQLKEQELISRLVRFYEQDQNEKTHLLVRCARDGEIRVGATKTTLLAHGLNSKLINSSLKKGLLQEERIVRNNTLVNVIVFWKKIDAEPDSLLDRIGLYLKKWLRKLKIN